MPKIYLSPSLQQYNLDVFGNTEEQNMNKIADAMEPYLIENGIQYVRNNPNQTLSEVIAQSNAGNFDAHLALHSNAAPPSLSGKIMGADAYYFPTSAKGKRLADIIVKNYENIYPYPDKVQARPTTTLAEVTRTRAPSVLFEVGYHDNPEDAQWILDNIDNIAKNLVQSLCEYFGIPFKDLGPMKIGVVTTQSTALNIRSQPNINSTVIGQMPKGARMEILGESGNWYRIAYNGTIGYSSKDFITVVSK